MIYHLRVFALGLLPAAAIAALFYGMTFLPLWLAEAPFVIAIVYGLGRAAEMLLWSQP